MISRIFDKVQRLVKWVLPFYLFTFLPLSLLSQTLTGSAPSHVAVGEQFRLTYTVNTQNASDFRAGDIPDELEVLIGPNRSMQSSYQMINGHTSSSSSITYTYIVSATKNGTFTIPAAHVVVGGKTISSNTLTIKVSGTAQSNSGGSSRQHRQDEAEEIRDAGSQISGSDLFIKVSANKKRVYEQEPILLTYKVYTLVGLTSLRGDMPDLKSFYTQEVSLPSQKSFSIETFNGRPYKTTTWSQYVMFPQMTGKLQIPSITFEGIVVQQNRNIDPFEAFFNGGSGYIEVKKKIVAPGIEIQVDPLPERPAGFSGGVGHFSVSASLNKTETKANDPVTQGHDELPPVSMTYFDTTAKAYKTVTSQPLVLDVAKGSGPGAMTDFSGQQDLQELSRDIRYIKTGDVRQQGIDEFFFGSVAYWITLAIMALVFISLFVIFRQRAIENANITKRRAGKANKVATKRLKKASKLMEENKPGEFYDEVLRALWGYVGEETIAQFIGALDECEFERYAPGDPKGNMNKVYEKAMTAIEQIEGTMKKRKVESGKWNENTHVRMILLTVISLSSFLFPLSSHAVTKAEADSAYVRGQYQQAINDYEELLKQGASADLYYNLGNAYYRTENIPEAVLNYERALLLSPGDRDIRFNLQIARSKTFDKIVPESEMFFVTWYRSLVSMMSVDGWARTALVALALTIILLLVYLFSEKIWLRKTGFFGGVALLVLFVVANIFAWQQKQELLHRKGAIIFAPAVTVKSTPAANGTDLFILHEGTKVDITDGSMKDWKEIRIADGKEGWIESKHIRVI